MANEGNEEIIENQSDEENHDEIEAIPVVKKFQAQDDVSCIQMNHPEVNIMVNSSDVPMAFLIKDSVTGKKVILAPGEGKIP